MKKTEAFYRYETWHKAYLDQMLQSAGNSSCITEDVFIAANFINTLWYGENLFDHIEEIQSEWEKCDDMLKMSILSGWEIMDAEADREYDHYITHDSDGKPLDPGRNIKLS